MKNKTHRKAKRLLPVPIIPAPPVIQGVTFRSADGRTVQIRADFLGSIWVNDVRYVPAK